MSQSPVMLFSDQQFAGSSVPLDEGHTRFISDFNDSTSSIRVTPGYCAMLYEHANEFGGYGAWVDLLEDCPDLSVYGFDKKTSYVHVFRIERDGFVWARGAISDGQFVPGHWERKRASGGSDLNGTVAVVAPPLPPPTTPMPADGGGVIVIRDHRGEPGTTTGDPVVHDHRASKIKHVFVLMLENRSFDHMLGFSGITGVDPFGDPTIFNAGFDPNTTSNVNPVTGLPVLVSTPAEFQLEGVDEDPGHEFENTLVALCGSGAQYTPTL